MLYKRIMAAVDDSDTSILALKEAIKLAKNQKAKLQIIHIIEDLYEGDADRDLLVAARKEEGQQVLNKVKKITNRTKVEYETLLAGFNSSGRVSEQIVEKAKSWRADLIVLGTHGHSGIFHILDASVAEEIIRIATTPVLIIRSPD